MKKQWLIFGAGGIGRALIGQIANNSGYKIIFVAKDKEQKEFLSSLSKYTINFLGHRNKKSMIIKNFSVINFQDKSEIINSISSENLKIISTSVRAENLEEVARVIAEGLKERTFKKPFVILTCENIIGGAKNLKKMIEKEGKGISKKVIIPEIIVDCIVPKQPSNSRKINREKHGELLIESLGQKSDRILKKIANTKIVKKISKYQVQKIFGLNGMHLSVAILGTNQRIKYVHSTVTNKKTKQLLLKLSGEITEAIYQEVKLPKASIKKYLKNVLNRFSNPLLPDENKRIIRNLKKKLGPEERLLKPAKIIYKNGKVPKALIEVIGKGIKLVMKEEKISNPQKAVKIICQIPKKFKSLEEAIIKAVQ